MEHRLCSCILVDRSWICAKLSFTRDPLVAWEGRSYTCHTVTNVVREIRRLNFTGNWQARTDSGVTVHSERPCRLVTSLPHRSMWGPTMPEKKQREKTKGLLHGNVVLDVSFDQWIRVTCSFLCNSTTLRFYSVYALNGNLMQIGVCVCAYAYVRACACLCVRACVLVCVRTCISDCDSSMSVSIRLAFALRHVSVPN